MQKRHLVFGWMPEEGDGLRESWTAEDRLQITGDRKPGDCQGTVTGQETFGYWETSLRWTTTRGPKATLRGILEFRTKFLITKWVRQA
jgi:hypothetical protein